MKEKEKVHVVSQSYSSCDSVTVVYGTTRRHLVNTYSRELGVRGIFIFIRLRLTLIRMRDADYGESARHYNAPLSSLRVASRTRAARYSGIEVTAP